MLNNITDWRCADKRVTLGRIGSLLGWTVVAVIVGGLIVEYITSLPFIQFQASVPGNGAAGPILYFAPPIVLFGAGVFVAWVARRDDSVVLLVAINTATVLGFIYTWMWLALMSAGSGIPW